MGFSVLSWNVEHFGGGETRGKKKDKARNGSRGREPAEREDAFMSMGMMRRKPREAWARARIRHSAAAPHVRARA